MIFKFLKAGKNDCVGVKFVRPLKNLEPFTL